MDKDITKRLLDDAGIKGCTIYYTDGSPIKMIFPIMKLLNNWGSLFIKPANLGSSVGISKVNNEAKAYAALSMAF